MPYIKKQFRAELDPHIDKLLDILVQNGSTGNLTYCLYKLCLGWISCIGMSYQEFVNVIGALETTKLELYRRETAPYEDIKITMNGDVSNEVSTHDDECFCNTDVMGCDCTPEDIDHYVHDIGI